MYNNDLKASLKHMIEK